MDRLYFPASMRSLPKQFSLQFCLFSSISTFSKSDDPPVCLPFPSLTFVVDIVFVCVQGKVRLWVEIIPKKKIASIPIINIKKPPPEPFQMRIVIWSARNMVSMDSVTKMNDLYITGIFEAIPEGSNGTMTVKQETDIVRSLIALVYVCCIGLVWFLFSFIFAESSYVLCCGSVVGLLPLLYFVLMVELHGLYYLSSLLSLVFAFPL